MKQAFTIFISVLLSQPCFSDCSEFKTYTLKQYALSAVVASVDRSSIKLVQTTHYAPNQSVALESFGDTIKKSFPDRIILDALALEVSTLSREVPVACEEYI